MRIIEEIYNKIHTQMVKGARREDLRVLVGRHQYDTLRSEVGDELQIDVQVGVIGVVGLPMLRVTLDDYLEVVRA